MEKGKRFDAVAMVRQIRDRHYEQTKDMTEEERLAFYLEKGGKAQLRSGACGVFRIDRRRQHADHRAPEFLLDRSIPRRRARVS